MLNHGDGIDISVFGEPLGLGSADVALGGSIIYADEKGESGVRGEWWGEAGGWGVGLLTVAVDNHHTRTPQSGSAGPGAAGWFEDAQWCLGDRGAVGLVSCW